MLTYNQNLFDSQWATVQNDLAHALSQLAAVQQNLQDRAAGLIKGGTPPTVESVQRKCEQILHRQHLRQLVQTTVTLDAAGAAPVELSSRRGRPAAITGYLPGQNAAHYRLTSNGAMPKSSGPIGASL